jgi:MFS family permease
MDIGAGGQGGVRYGTASGRWILLATVLGSALTFLDMSVISVALPHIGRDLDSSTAGLQWAVNGYTLTLASLILLCGALGDRLGRRRGVIAGALWFPLACRASAAPC